MLKFSKFQGAGNDFILIDDRMGVFPMDKIQRLCHRRFGVGADGLILVQEAQGGADIRMRYFNCDGGEAFCGNGLRCFGKFLLELGFAPQKTKVFAYDRIVELFYRGDEVGVSLGAPRGMALYIPTERGVVHFVHTGVPHVVHWVDDLEGAPLQELGPFWRHHPLFAPEGANVNLAKRQAEEIEVRTYERGVEGETLACGTGAAAVAAIAQALYQTPTPIPIACKGGRLEVHIGPIDLSLLGPAQSVFSGTY